MLPVTVNVNAAAPTEAEVCEREPMDGATSPVIGVETVNVEVPEVPSALDTVMVAGPGKAVSVGKIAAVIWVALTKVVARDEPFQLTTASLVKFVPVTVSVRPFGLHDGVEAFEVVEADSEVIAGGVPGAAPIVKRTILETSVVVVALVLELPEAAEPGMSMAITTVPTAER